MTDPYRDFPHIFRNYPHDGRRDGNGFGGRRSVFNEFPDRYAGIGSKCNSCWQESPPELL